MKIILAEISSLPPKELKKKDIKKETLKIVSEISLLKKKMMAQKKYSILMVLQGMDASGKDGIVNSIFKSISPIGVKVKSFKKPTDEEFAHDFLWRIHKHMPQRGEISIFNRSHYEDILVPSVYKYIDEDTIQKRFNHINNFEKSIQDNDTVILKFYLNVSKEKQIERLNERKEIKEKHWKHSDNDWKVVDKRSEFETVYETIFKECNDVPWHIVPADKNWYKAYYVAKELLKALKSMTLEWPELESEK